LGGLMLGSLALCPWAAAAAVRQAVEWCRTTWQPLLQAL